MKRKSFFAVRTVAVLENQYLNIKTLWCTPLPPQAMFQTNCLGSTERPLFAAVGLWWATESLGYWVCWKRVAFWPSLPLPLQCSLLTATSWRDWFIWLKPAKLSLRKCPLGASPGWNYLRVGLHKPLLSGISNGNKPLNVNLTAQSTELGLFAC